MAMVDQSRSACKDALSVDDLLGDNDYPHIAMVDTIGTVLGSNLSLFRPNGTLFLL